MYCTVFHYLYRTWFMYVFAYLVDGVQWFYLA